MAAILPTGYLSNVLLAIFKKLLCNLQMVSLYVISVCEKYLMSVALGTLRSQKCTQGPNLWTFCHFYAL